MLLYLPKHNLYHLVQTKTPLERGVSLLSKQSIKTKIFKLLAHDFCYRRLFTDKFIGKTG